MTEPVIYLLKANIALVLFYAGYMIALRKLTFHTLNRWFLLFGILFSSLYPFIDLPAIREQAENINSSLLIINPDWNAIQTTAGAGLQLVSTTNAGSQPVSFPFGSYADYRLAAMIIFWTGVFCMLLRFAVQLISLYRIHRNSKPETHFRISYRSTDKNLSPFSFWRKIYLNPGNHSKAELKTILKHEQVHVKELHTADVLLAELATIFYWFNPGVWLIREAIRENLEFITDHKVLQSGMDKKTYQYQLLTLGSSFSGIHTANNFNFQGLKRRIIMMNSKSSPRLHLSRYFLILPALMIFTAVFTYVKPAQKETGGISIRNETIDITSLSAEDKLNAIKKYTGKNPIYLINGIGYATDRMYLFALGTGRISQALILTGDAAVSAYGPEAEDGVIILENTTPALNMSSGVVKAENAGKFLDVFRKEYRGLLYVVDGQPEGKDYNAERLTGIENILMISVKSAESAKKIYGPAARLGAIEIETVNTRNQSLLRSMKYARMQNYSVAR